MGDDKLVRAVRQRARRKQALTNAVLKDQAERTVRKGYHELKFVNPVAFNAKSEEAFVELVRQLIEGTHGGTYSVFELINREAPYRLKISSTTAQRYFLKHTASTAEFRSFGDIVMLNPNYVPPEGWNVGSAELDQLSKDEEE